MPAPSSALASTLLLGVAMCVSGCIGAPPESLENILAEASSTAPVRLWIEGDRIVAAAVPLGPGAIPKAARTTAAAITPGGDEVFAGREWRADGSGYRIEVHHQQGATESFRSVLLTADGDVIERTHTLPITDIPVVVLTNATQIGRQLIRCEIVSNADEECGWRAQVRDGLGRVHAVEMRLDGSIVRARRVLEAQLHVDSNRQPRP